MIKRFIAAVAIVAILAVGAATTGIGSRLGSPSFAEPQATEAWNGVVVRCYMLSYWGGGAFRYCTVVGYN